VAVISGTSNRHETPQRKYAFLTGGQSLQNCNDWQDKFLTVAAGTDHGAVGSKLAPGRWRQRRRLQHIRERKRDRCAVTNFALNFDRAAVEIDD
jgi:hypothetical protein